MTLRIQKQESLQGKHSEEYSKDTDETEYTDDYEEDTADSFTI